VNSKTLLHLSIIFNSVSFSLLFQKSQKFRTRLK